MLQENIVKVVARHAVDSATVCIIWRLFVFRNTCKPQHFDSVSKSQNAEACMQVDLRIGQTHVCERKRIWRISGRSRCYILKEEEPAKRRFKQRKLDDLIISNKIDHLLVFLNKTFFQHYKQKRCSRKTYFFVKNV